MKNKLKKRLKEYKDIPGAYRVKIDYKSSRVRILIDPDGEKLDNIIKTAEKLISSLEKYDNLAKDALAKELLNTYNENWSSYEETQEDGSTVSVVNPLLSKDEFISKLTLNSITLIGEKIISMDYNDSDLFWGHQPYVSSSNGLDFTGANVGI